MTAAARRIVLRRLLDEQNIASQAEIVDLLAEAGHHVTQATVSRDLGAIHAYKATEPDGTTRYVLGLPSHRHDNGTLDRVIDNWVEKLIPSGNVLVIKTPPGAAHLVGGAIDQTDVPGIVGTVAGDDTVLVVTEEQVGAARVARILETGGEQ